MTPWPGNNLATACPPREWFNFFHSQLRITIERTFGIFIGRWGIFWGALCYDLEMVYIIIHACVRLHNFCVRRNLPILQKSTQRHSDAPLLDTDGRLEDERWVDNNVDTDEWADNNIVLGVNALREDITNTCRDNNYYATRNYT